MVNEKVQPIAKEITTKLKERREKLDAYYKDMLTRAVPESSVISLSNIPEGVKEERVSQLNHKLKEYQEREIDSFFVPEEFEEDWYKGEALRILLKDGLIHSSALELAIQKEDGGISENKFYRVLGVIDRYVVSGGEGNRGGTGLVEINN